MIDAHLRTRRFLVGATYTIADIAVFAYSRLADEAGIDTTAYVHFGRWLDRIADQPSFMDDLLPYPPNASVLVGKSIYG
jgi:glutathione S-transferase